MSRYTVALKPTGAIPRDPALTLRMRRVTPRSTAAGTGDAPAATTIGAGADMFADATVIPYGVFRDVVAAYTYNKTLTAESGEPSVVNTPATPTSPNRTAWWRVTVPAGKVAWLSADTQLSFGIAGVRDCDTQLGVSIVLGYPEPPTFADLNLRASSEDVDQASAAHEDAYNFGYYSRVANVWLNGDDSGDPRGTMYYINVGSFDPSADICYVVRVSITETEPGTVPADGHDPAA